jgi:hypothetical protein
LAGAAEGAKVTAATLGKPIFGGLGAIRAQPWLGTTVRNAEAMEKAGATAQDIWEQLALFRGLDNKWRYWIPDTGAALRPVVANPSTQLTLSNVLDHPELYKHYPDLKNLQVRLLPDDSPENAHYYTGDRTTLPYISYKPNAIDSDPLSAVLHEVQHVVAGREGYPRGTSIRDTYKALSDDPTNPFERYLAAAESYYLNPGELESRLVQWQHANPSFGGNRVPSELLQDMQNGIRELYRELRLRAHIDPDFGNRILKENAEMRRLLGLPPRP